jgi:hypothetical protein
MPHSCRLCGRRRANERFSGRGHRIHVCRDCQALPKEERRTIEARREIEGFLFHQSHISNRNLERLRELTRSNDPAIVKTAAVVLQVAVVAPYKRKRLRVLRRVQPNLIEALVDLDFLAPMDPFPTEEEWDWLDEEDTSEALESEDFGFQEFEESLDEDIPF